MAIGPTQNVITIAVMGATGTGKSTFINLLSNSNFEVGKGLKSCTPAVQMSNEFTLSGRCIRLLDTPGFDDTTKTDREILNLIASYLADQYRHDVKLSGIIYMHRISDFKMGGISKRNFGMFRTLCGEKTLKNVVIVTNMWGEVDEALGVRRETELITDNQFFKPVLDNGARIMRNFNTLASAQGIVQTLIDNHPEPLRIQSEIVDEHKLVEQTEASAKLESEGMAEARRKQEEELQRQREAAAAALRAQQEQQARALAKQQEQARLAREAAEARAREEQSRMLAAQQEARRQEQQRLQEAQRQLEIQAAARAQEEERIRQIQAQEEQRRQAEEAERRWRQAELERLVNRPRHRHRNDCIIC